VNWEVVISARGLPLSTNNGAIGGLFHRISGFIHLKQQLVIGQVAITRELRATKQSIPYFHKFIRQTLRNGYFQYIWLLLFHNQKERAFSLIAGFDSAVSY